MKNQFLLIFFVLFLHQYAFKDVLRLKAIPNKKLTYHRKLSADIHSPMEQVRRLHRHNYQAPKKDLRQEALVRNKRKLNVELGEAEGKF